MIEQTLNNAESRNIAANGNYIYCDAGSKVRVVTARANWVLAKNEGVEVEPFDEVQVENISGAAELIKLRAGYGRLDAAKDKQQVEVSNAVAINDTTPIDVNVTAQPAVTATVNHSDKLVPLSDVALTPSVATLVAAANVKRIELMVKNPSSNTIAVRLGDATVAAAQGYELEPGESVILSSSAAVYAFGAAAESLSLTSLEIV